MSVSASPYTLIVLCFFSFVLSPPIVFSFVMCMTHMRVCVCVCVCVCVWKTGAVGKWGGGGEEGLRWGGVCKPTYNACVFSAKCVVVSCKLE